MNTPLEQARRRVERSRFIPIYLLVLLLAYGCIVVRKPRDHSAETLTPTVKNK